MTVDSATPRTRRAILAASLGGAVAVVANAIGRATPVAAADGQTMVVGGGVLGLVKDSSRDERRRDYAFWGASEINIGVVGTSTSSNGVQGESGSAIGVNGYSRSGTGVRGESAGGGPGVIGNSSSGPGVRGLSGSHIGVLGESTAAVGTQGTSDSGIGVAGGANTGIGVEGLSGSGTGVVGASPANAFGGTGPARTAVYGLAKFDGTARGVTGETTSGRGINGISTSGRGVHGQATTGEGGFFTASATSGTGLRTNGKVKFDKSVGLATIASGTASVVVTPGIDLTATSAVVATLQGDAGGATAVKRVAVNATNNTFTVFLTANSTASVKVAWHVFG